MPTRKAPRWKEGRDESSCVSGSGASMFPQLIGLSVRSDVHRTSTSWSLDHPILGLRFGSPMDAVAICTWFHSEQVIRFVRETSQTWPSTSQVLPMHVLCPSVNLPRPGPILNKGGHSWFHQRGACTSPPPSQDVGAGENILSSWFVCTRVLALRGAAISFPRFRAR